MGAPILRRRRWVPLAFLALLVTAAATVVEVALWSSLPRATAPPSPLPLGVIESPGGSAQLFREPKVSGAQPVADLPNGTTLSVFCVLQGAKVSSRDGKTTDRWYRVYAQRNAVYVPSLYLTVPGRPRSCE
jgi:hypothetical protein